MNFVSTHSPAAPRKIMTFTGRSRTVPGFLRSAQRDVDNYRYQPEKKQSQEEQDAEDERARRNAMKNLVNSWQERLQLISVITTFFASTEAAMLVNTKPGETDRYNYTLQASNAALFGSLILHVYASVLSFLGAFLLISYKLKEARRDELLAEGVIESPLRGSLVKDVEQAAADLGLRQIRTSMDGTNGAPSVEPTVFSSNPHVEQVLPFASNGLSHLLLSRTHALCVFLAAIGFVLAIIGIVCYAWALQPIAVSIFATVTLGGALLSMIGLRISSFAT